MVYVHAGWIGALGASVLTWLVAKFLITISGSNRELIEGIASLLAAVVLFYVSYWLLAKLEAKKWTDFIRSKVEMALSTGHVMALAGVSFLAVYGFTPKSLWTLMSSSLSWVSRGRARVKSGPLRALLVDKNNASISGILSGWVARSSGSTSSKPSR